MRLKRLSPVHTAKRSHFKSASECKRQLVAPINSIPLYIESHKSCQTVNFLTSNQAKSSLNPAELVLNPGEVWRLLFCCATSAMMVSAPWSFQTLWSSDRLFLLVISSAVVEYTDLYLIVPIMSHCCLHLQIKDVKSCLNFHCNQKTVYSTTDFLTKVVSYILVSTFNVTWSVCLAALLPGTQIAFVESKAKSFTLTPANPEWEERC